MKNTTLGVKSLVRRECANFNYEDSFCYPMDCKCRYYGEIILDEDDKPVPVRCKYFEKGVLPLDPKLECDYRIERKLSIDESVDRCESCGDYIRKSSGKQKYCNKCKKIVRRESRMNI
jgi:hypothetical protein